jgi:hypothetical protein
MVCLVCGLPALVDVCFPNRPAIANGNRGPERQQFLAKEKGIQIGRVELEKRNVVKDYAYPFIRTI